MTEEKPSPAAPDAGHIPMTEELDSARWTLPPILPVIGAAVVVALLVAAYSRQAAKPGTQGSIKKVAAAQVSESSVLVLVQVHLENPADKPLYIRNSKATLEAAGAKHEDAAAAVSDLDRYLGGFPALQPYRIAPLRPESKIAPGAQVDGMVLFAFPVSLAAFEQRRSLVVTVDLYDRTPLVLREKK